MALWLPLIALALAGALGAAEPAPLDLYGVRPGMAVEEVRELLGAPGSVKDSKGEAVWGYPRGRGGRLDPEIYWAEGKVALVVGSRLTRGDEELVARGASEEEVREALGHPDHEEEAPGGVRLMHYAADQLQVVIHGGKVAVFGLGEQP